VCSSDLSLARYASPVFELARHAVPDPWLAWQAMLAYTLQLYFDFSGYSDMAIGLGLLFGFKLPINFLSPYKASSISEFWRRWHITLSTFLRDYLYIPLGGNRAGPWKTARNLLITMLLGGLWHGAGWNFLFWGLLHGILLLLHQAWQRCLRVAPPFHRTWSRLQTALGVAITFCCVNLAWVLFRSADLETSLRIYRALFSSLTEFSLSFPLSLATWIGLQTPGQILEAFAGTRPEAAWWWIAAGLLTTMALPNTSQLLSYDPTPNLPCRIPRLMVGLLSGCCLWLSLKWMAVNPSTEFLYFNF
jgi:D-alanyl-lipoteichoic acid acyltransferase DltB (MBOAT superfamily)